MPSGARALVSGHDRGRACRPDLSGGGPERRAVREAAEWVAGRTGVEQELEFPRVNSKKSLFGQLGRVAPEPGLRYFFGCRVQAQAR